MIKTEDCTVINRHVYQHALLSELSLFLIHLAFLFSQKPISVPLTGEGGRLEVIPEGTYLSTHEDPVMALDKPSKEMSCVLNIMIQMKELFLTWSYLKSTSIC